MKKILLITLLLSGCASPKEDLLNDYRKRNGSNWGSWSQEQRESLDSQMKELK